MIRNLAILSIRGYQRFISPHKGFCCAYHHETGGYSCSTYALIIVRDFGILAL